MGALRRAPLKRPHWVHNMCAHIRKYCCRTHCITSRWLGETALCDTKKNCRFHSRRFSGSQARKWIKWKPWGYVQLAVCQMCIMPELCIFAFFSQRVMVMQPIYFLNALYSKCSSFLLIVVRLWSNKELNSVDSIERRFHCRWDVSDILLIALMLIEFMQRMKHLLQKYQRIPLQHTEFLHRYCAVLRVETFEKSQKNTNLRLESVGKRWKMDKLFMRNPMRLRTCLQSFKVNILIRSEVSGSSRKNSVWLQYRTRAQLFTMEAVYRRHMLRANTVNWTENCDEWLEMKHIDRTHMRRRYGESSVKLWAHFRRAEYLHDIMCGLVYEYKEWLDGEQCQCIQTTTPWAYAGDG